ncbi:DNA primase small subunit domain-containing protein [Actinacidiphila sp. DG2A-62]|jgi:bifunctional non-homologous end joining protein LigD|uniref:DNA polymerase domain-containing protein n=1 Tax=Actinacidiphila sp. DG2A-62 TaxID=3108821 RepID=UPI002DBA3D8C|nr:DNA primase small subunit domain-containing protein [Actinacidiphila sp. DG2A-62]MEC3997877.1 DNA primase small subunit domain-containing protein [Actinacidiphila sp. DG2A-62]
MSTLAVDAGRRTVEVARAEKVLFPAGPDAPAVTKADLAAYYREIAPYAVPHLKGRPLMLEMHPDGIGGRPLMRKNVPAHFPDWVHRAELAKEDGTVCHVLADDAPTLVYLAGQGCTTLHRFLSRADRPRHPDLMVFDLDPAGDDFAPVRTAALQLGELLDAVRLPWAPMTSGSRGLHLVVPLDRGSDVDEVRELARAIAETLAARHPDTLTTKARKAERGDRLYLDVMRNGYAQTAVAPWSVRALPGAPVAAPLPPDALHDTSLHPRAFTVRDALAHARTEPWAGLLPARHPRGLRGARSRLDAVR